MAKIKDDDAAEEQPTEQPELAPELNTVDDPAPYVETEATIAEGRRTVPAQPAE